MKKPEKSLKKKKASIKRGLKRNLRLKKTQTEKGVKKAAFLADKKEKAQRYIDSINKIIQSRLSSS